MTPERLEQIFNQWSKGNDIPREVVGELIEFIGQAISPAAWAVSLRQNLELDREVDRLRNQLTLYAKQRDDAESARARLEGEVLSARAERDLAQAMHSEAARQRDECAEELARLRPGGPVMM